MNQWAQERRETWKTTSGPSQSFPKEHGGNSRIAWSCITRPTWRRRDVWTRMTTRRTEQCVIDVVTADRSRVTSGVCRSTLSAHILPHAGQMDKSTEHATQATPAFLKAKKLDIPQCLRQSADLNLNRAFLHFLKTERGTNKHQRTAAAVKVWSSSGLQTGNSERG